MGKMNLNAFNSAIEGAQKSLLWFETEPHGHLRLNAHQAGMIAGKEAIRIITPMIRREAYVEAIVEVIIIAAIVFKIRNGSSKSISTIYYYE